MSVAIRQLRVRGRSKSSAVSALASWGLATRATNYLLVGVLVLILAAGGRAGETDQQGALKDTMKHTGGAVLVWIIVCGLLAYALWRFDEAAFGVRGTRDGKEARPRLVSLGRGVAYTVLAANAIKVATSHSSGSQSSRQEEWSAQVMRHTGGRWAIGILGVGLVVFGIAQVVKGVRRTFEKEFKLNRMSPASRRTVRTLGAVGCPGRGIVFALVGVFLLVAAIQYDPGKAGGLDAALHQLRTTPAGPWLLGLVGAGLILFGLYGYCEAMWRRT